MSSEGLTYGDEDGRKISKVSTLARAGDRLLVGVEAPGIFESRDNGETWSLLSTLSGQHGSEAWDDPANQPPGHLGISGFVTDPGDSDNFFAIVQGVGAFETEDGGSSWTPRNKGLRRDWPADYEDVGFCVHKLVRSLRPASACTSRTTSACTARTTPGSRGPRSPRACRATSASPRPFIRTTPRPST